MNGNFVLSLPLAIVVAISGLMSSQGLPASANDDLRLVCPEPDSGEDPYYRRTQDGKTFSADGPKDLAKLLKICYNMMQIEALSNPLCGNGFIEGDESCDGANLGGASCESLNWSGGGVLSCDQNCMLDTTNCIPSCDDGILNGDETSIDCGGGTCDSCSNGGSCQINSDCSSGICASGVCAFDAQCGQPCDGDDADLCEEGVNECTSNALQCNDTSGDNQELCNGLDDDCDSNIDEDIAPVPTSTACRVEVCDGGSTQIENAPDGSACMVGTDQGDCQNGVCEVPCNPSQTSCAN